MFTNSVKCVLITFDLQNIGIMSPPQQFTNSIQVASTLHNPIQSIFYHLIYLSQVQKLKISENFILTEIADANSRRNFSSILKNLGHRIFQSPSVSLLSLKTLSYLQQIYSSLYFPVLSSDYKTLYLSDYHPVTRRSDMQRAVQTGYTRYSRRDGHHQLRLEHSIY